MKAKLSRKYEALNDRIHTHFRIRHPNCGKRDMFRELLEMIKHRRYSLTNDGVDPTTKTRRMLLRFLVKTSLNVATDIFTGVGIGRECDFLGCAARTCFAK